MCIARSRVRKSRSSSQPADFESTQLTNIKYTKESQTWPKSNLRPLDDRVVVEPIEAEEMTAGGIVLPDTAKEKPQRGTVVAVGPGKLLDSGSRGELSVASRR